MEASTAPLTSRLARPGRRLLASDGGLVDGVRRGDRSAFDLIFDRHHRALLSFCRHMLGTREEAEDAVQETFLAAYRDLRRSTRSIQLKPWLYAIARNQCLSRLRGRRPSTALEDSEPITEGLAAEVQRREDLRQMLSDIQQLPEDQRAALVLAELGALSYGEIAAVIGCPAAKVKALVFQARSSLAADRAARDTACSAIRQQLSTLSGSALRRAGLRRHLRQCSGCQQFEADVRRQRAAIAVLLPVLPTAGWQEGVLAALGTPAGAGAAGAGAAGSSAGAVVTGVGTAKLTLAGVAVVAAVGGAAAIFAGGGVPWAAGRDTPPATQSPREAGGASGGSGMPKRGVLGVIVFEARRAAGEVGAPRGAARGASGTAQRSQTGRGPEGSSAANREAARVRSSDLGRSGARREGGRSRDRTRSGGRSNVGPAQPPAAQPKSKEKTNRGRSDSAPGRTGSTPGQSGQTPGNGAPPPGKSGNTPGKLGNTPGKSGYQDGNGESKGGGEKSGNSKSDSGKGKKD